MALFAGAYLSARALSFAAPFGALALSDALLGGFYPGISFVYFSFALTVLIGWAISSRKTPLTIGAAALASSFLFFVISNFGTWLLMDMYPKTLERSCCLLCRGDPVLPEHRGRGPFLRRAAVRRLRNRRAGRPGTAQRTGGIGRLRRTLVARRALTI
jgi:hypothetical protein